MIFVTVGNARQPFDRLISAVERAVDAGVITGEVVVQHGHSRAPRVGTVRRTFDRGEFEGCLRRARIIICHAGVGSVLDSLRHGKRPIVMARRKPLDEMVNNHQVDLATKLGMLGLVFVVENAEEIAACLRRPPGDFTVDPPAPNPEPLRVVREFLGAVEANRER